MIVRPININNGVTFSEFLDLRWVQYEVLARRRRWGEPKPEAIEIKEMRVPANSLVLCAIWDRLKPGTYEGAMWQGPKELDHLPDPGWCGA